MVFCSFSVHHSASELSQLKEFVHACVFSSPLMIPRKKEITSCDILYKNGIIGLLGIEVFQTD